MKKQKKVLALVLCAVMLVASSVLATMAYLTDTTREVKNTFTVGKVGISLDEAVVDEYGVATTDERTEEGNEYKLIPGHTYLKDPTVYVDEGSEDSYLFVKVENGLKDAEAAENTIAAQMTAKGWTLVEGNYYVYNTVVSENEEVEVFAEFILADDVDVADFASAEIKVTAYAVQADGLTAEQAFDALEL